MKRTEFGMWIVPPGKWFLLSDDMGTKLPGFRVIENKYRWDDDDNWTYGEFRLNDKSLKRLRSIDFRVYSQML